MIYAISRMTVPQTSSVVTDWWLARRHRSYCRWPARAMHAPGDFPVGELDVRGHAVLRYRFDKSVYGILAAEPETRPETVSERGGGKRRKAGLRNYIFS